MASSHAPGGSSSGMARMRSMNAAMALAFRACTSGVMGRTRPLASLQGTRGLTGIQGLAAEHPSPCHDPGLRRANPWAGPPDSFQTGATLPLYVVRRPASRGSSTERGWNGIPSIVRSIVVRNGLRPPLSPRPPRLRVRWHPDDSRGDAETRRGDASPVTARRADPSRKASARPINRPSGCRKTAVRTTAARAQPPVEPAPQLPCPGWTQGLRYGRASSRLASSSPTTLCACGSQVSVRPSLSARLARMQLAVEM